LPTIATLSPCSSRGPISRPGARSDSLRADGFDLNDFDETLPGPFEWDVKRLATSFEIAGRDRNFARTERKDAVLAAVRSYGEAMPRLAAMGELDVWYARLDARAIDQ
jgi:uncharacterized protein (DUF2252 family)